MKKELEIALTTYIALEHNQDECFGFISGFEAGSKAMYSEEEVIKIVEKSRETGLTAEFLLLTEQFKK